MDIFTDRLVLKTPDKSMPELILSYYSRNSDHFADAMPKVPQKFYTLEHQSKSVENHEKLMRQNKLFRFYAFYESDPNKIIADISVGNILKENLSCQLSYKVDKDELEKGIASEMVQAVINYLFSETKMRRIELYITENNIASIKFANKLGFTKEGVARKYMEINGDWKDHIQFSLLKDEHES